ncbi:MAG: hypothetical protein M1823_002721 [Watsoniomyces obsoletus]|nr:MAG: hypothetical protein M1823_002721 [Watsoniomyces obsoletus]
MIVPPCRLNPLLFNGHIQTVWTIFKDPDIPIYYRRKVFKAEDPAYEGSFAVDFVVSKHEGTDPLLPPRTVYFGDNQPDGPHPSDDTRPMLVALHGLSGGSHELYLRHVLAPLVDVDGGWEACVVNSRGCALSKITSSVLFNARATWDVRQVVKWLHRRYPNRPLFGVGFSLGANILVNYVGEEGPDCILKGAVVCSNPWNLEVSSVALFRTTIGREVYSRVMAENLKKLIEIEIQCPTWGYPTVGAYYRDASSSDSLLSVRIPLLGINAEDDPVRQLSVFDWTALLTKKKIAAKEAIPYDEFKRNPYTVLCTTSMGGHLAWFETGGGRWFVKPVTRFLQELAKGVHSGEIQVKPTEDFLRTSRGVAEASLFDPVRRKLHIPEDENPMTSTHTTSPDYSLWPGI